MWLSEKMAGSAAEDAILADGVVTVGGQHPAVLIDGEERDAHIAAPGGYFWRPAPADPVVVSRSGGVTILGLVQKNAALAPGEIRICTGAASLSLFPDGRISLNGELYLNGEKLEADSL